ncbi:uncharacterized protein LOC134817923 [Bolinopsis microptera]|uniref:uncharacterized protein LOC134817923 n=1 Tax=Bolinopsis microptera TaxID=2820187 RepID=UPI0030793B6B
MEAEQCCLNPKDFVTFKTEIDLLCDDEVDVFKRWGILEDIQKTKVYNNVKMFLAAGGVEVLCYVAVSASSLTDRLIYLEHEEEEPFVKEPLGGIPPLGSLRVGSLTVIAELTKIEVYRRRIWGLNIIPKLCALFTKRMGYLLKFAPDRESLTKGAPKDQTLLLLEKILYCLSYLVVENSGLATELLKLLGHELVLITTTVNNRVICDSIAQLLDHCFLYQPDLDAVHKFLALNPHEKLHAIRPKCSMQNGRDHFDRFMINLDSYSVPKEEPKPLRKYDKVLSCGSCGATKQKMPVCRGCNEVHYCNAKCQTKHWLVHQITCVKG